MDCKHCGEKNIGQRWDKLHRVNVYWCYKCGWEELPEIKVKEVQFERPNRVKVGPKKWKIYCIVCGRPFYSKWTVTLLCKRKECHKIYNKLKRENDKG